jgi:antitoxin component of RelBE/YafQ-DinJ toxin-antitoxin module
MKIQKMKHRTNDCMLTLRLDRASFNGITKKATSLSMTRSQVVRMLIKNMLDNA